MKMFIMKVIMLFRQNILNCHGRCKNDLSIFFWIKNWDKWDTDMYYIYLTD
jgi:hypothetical protein